MRTAPQSIWPVSVFGLGFLLLVIGLSGVANIQETRSIHEQILSVEDNYRHIESLVESIRDDTSRVAVLRRDRLLEPRVSPPIYSARFTELRAKTEINLDQLRFLGHEQDSKAFERLEGALQAYLNTVQVEFQSAPDSAARGGFVDDGFGSQSMVVFAVAEELKRLNEENFESRRRALNQSVQNLQTDIWETILTALVLGAVIAGASIFRISSLEKDTERQQAATQQAEERLRHLSQQLVSSQ